MLTFPNLSVKSVATSVFYKKPPYSTLSIAIAYRIWRSQCVLSFGSRMRIWWVILRGVMSFGLLSRGICFSTIVFDVSDVHRPGFSIGFFADDATQGMTSCYWICLVSLGIYALIHTPVSRCKNLTFLQSIDRVSSLMTHCSCLYSRRLTKSHLIRHSGIGLLMNSVPIPTFYSCRSSSSDTWNYRYPFPKTIPNAHWDTISYRQLMTHWTLQEWTESESFSCWSCSHFAGWQVSFTKLLMRRFIWW